MKKIILIDYYGNCDASGKSVGHSPKALNEYRVLVQGTFQVEAVLPQCIIDEIDCELFAAVHKLPHQIVEEGNRNIVKRIFDKAKLFINISRALYKPKGDVLWFYRTDFFLFLYMFLHRKYKRCKLLCLVCQQKFAEGKLGNILNYIYQKEWAGLFGASMILGSCKGGTYIPILLLMVFIHEGQNGGRKGQGLSGQLAAGGRDFVVYL